MYKLKRCFLVKEKCLSLIYENNTYIIFTSFVRLCSGILLDFVFPLFWPLDICPLGVLPDVQVFKMHAGFEWTFLRYKREASSDIQEVAETLSISPLPQRLICSDRGVDSILITAEICIRK